MIDIQVIFLFTSLKNLTLEQKQQIQETVKDEYERFFNVSDAISIKLYDGQAVHNPNDIILAIASDSHIVNEGKIRGKMRDAVAQKIANFPFMSQMGFSGKIGLKDGLIETNDIVKPTDTGNVKTSNAPKESADLTDYKERAKQYIAVEPKYSFNQLKISSDTMNQIKSALGRIQFERKVFEEWGLHAIMPSPVCALSFYGAPGTGKSMAAEAIASHLGKKIIRASYADIENKYVGEGPKNVSAIFIAAEEQDAVLFIDEADSLLSKRLVNVSEPSGQAMNSMRSQLLISLENYHGIAIFATNLAINYDHAFVSRLINVEFKVPDASIREEIWKAHIYPTPDSKIQLNIPLADDINLQELAEKYAFVGRDIRNCVVNACVTLCMRGESKLSQAILIESADQLVNANNSIATTEDTTQKKSATPEQHALAEIIRKTKETTNETAKEV